MVTETSKIIKKYREAKNLSQKELSLILGTQASSINKYESGSRLIPLNMISLMVETLDIPIKEFKKKYYNDRIKLESRKLKDTLERIN